MESSNVPDKVSRNEIDSEELEKMRQQFEAQPYPNVPLEDDLKDDVHGLFLNSLVTAQYVRNQQVVSSEGKLILDVGCGSGYTSLMLAQANPGSKIYGVDISEKSVDLAQKRLAFHGFQASEFQVLSIYDLPQLGLKFDYINCTDVLYLLPDQLQALEAMKAILQPDGIIRANFHSLTQRFYMFQAQKLFKFMGLMEGPIGDEELEVALSVIDAVKDNVLLKTLAWRGDTKTLTDTLRANSLLQGDRGFTIPEVFDLLRQSDLEFISMLEWRKWDVMELFKDPENLPPLLALSLPECSIEEQLHLFELLQPANRLIDFWCGHTGQGCGKEAIAEWTPEQWQQSTIYLHPQMKTEAFRGFLADCITYQAVVDITRHWPGFFPMPILLDGSISSCLLALWDGGQPFDALVRRWLAVRPIDPVTLEPVTEEVAARQIRKFFKNLEDFSCVMVERPRDDNP